MTRQRGPRTTGQESEALFQPSLEVVERKRTQTGGGQLDRQWNSVESNAEAAQRSELTRVEYKAGVRLLTALQEQLLGVRKLVDTRFD
jgi:hypothetical protein